MSRFIGAIALSVLAGAATANAALIDLMPGGATGLVGTTSAVDTELAGSTSSMVDVEIPFQIFGNGGANDGPPPLLYEGILQNRIVTSDDTGEFHFYYRIRDTNGSLNGILGSVETFGFADWTTRVEYRTDSLGDVGPSRAERSAGTGDALHYLFGNPFFAPEESLFFFAATEAMNYTMAKTTIYLTTGESVTLDTFAPAIPSPGSWAIFGVGGLAVVRRRRR
ncbi:MAG: hypothetical protein KDA20_02185 [Phycisphaerales bacterium]|nr:hypothetical protein [Phycisphaerales bacterium]